MDGKKKLKKQKRKPRCYERKREEDEGRER